MDIKDYPLSHYNEMILAMRLRRLALFINADMK